MLSLVHFPEGPFPNSLKHFITTEKLWVPFLASHETLISTILHVWIFSGKAQQGLRLSLSPPPPPPPLQVCANSICKKKCQFCHNETICECEKLLLHPCENFHFLKHLSSSHWPMSEPTFYPQVQIMHRCVASSLWVEPINYLTS